MARIAPVAYDYDGSEETVRGQRPARSIRRRRAWTESGGGGPVSLLSLAVSANGREVIATYSGTPPADDNYVLGGTPVLVTGASDLGSVRTLTVDSAILGSETVTLSSDLLTAEAVTNSSGIELETVTKFLTANWSIPDTEYAAQRPFRAVTWPGGGGGDGGTVQGGSGAGGVSVIKDVASAKTGGYSGVVGAGGAAGANGTATAGGDSSVSDIDGVIALAKGQPPGVGGATGTGGVSTVTGSVGDTIRLGGNGAGGAGALTGGATAGSTSAASTSTPGAPGGTRVFAGNTGLYGTGGGVTAGPNSTGFAGGNGRFEITYQRAVVAATRPRIIGIRKGRDVANATTRNVVWPDGSDALDVASPQVGDIYVAIIAKDGAPHANDDISGFTELVNTGGNSSIHIYVKDYAGGEAVAFASDSQMVTWWTFLVRGGSGAADITATAANSSGNDPDPVSHDHGAVVDALWFTAFCSIQGSTNPIGVDGWPAGYEEQKQYLGPFTNGSTTLAIGWRELLATQVSDPSAWDTSIASTNGGAATCCIPKA